MPYSLLHSRLSALIHHARNRITGLIAELGQADTPLQRARIEQTLHQVAGQLGSVMALIRAGKDAEAVDLHEVELPLFFSDLSSEARSLCPPHLRLECHSDFSQAMFPVWMLDGQLVRLVVLDALMNAIRYARHTIRLEVSCQQNLLCLTMRDDGPGFPAEVLSGTYQPALEGQGNGLELARSVAARHRLGQQQGRIALSNANGAVFSLFLP